MEKNIGVAAAAKQGPEALAACLKDDNENVRIAAVEAFQDLGERAAPAVPRGTPPRARPLALRLSHPSFSLSPLFSAAGKSVLRSQTCIVAGKRPRKYPYKANIVGNMAATTILVKKRSSMKN